MIGDYEEETIAYTKLPKVSQLIKKFRKQTSLGKNETPVVDELERLISVAIVRQRPIVFVM